MLTLKDLNIEFQETVLSNGLRIFLFNRKGSPLSFKFNFLAGSRFDKIEGTAHFLEHIMAAGTKKFPTKNKLAAYIENFGGNFNAFTNTEVMSIYLAIGDSSDYSVLVELLKEMIFEPVFSDNNIETERGAILRELGNKKSTPKERIFDIDRKLVFQNTNIGRTTLGSEQSINSIKKQDLIEFYKKHILTGKMALVISGDISLEKIKKELEASLSKLKLVNKTFSKELDVFREKNISIENYKNIDQVQISLGYRIPKSFDPEFSTLRFITEALGKGSNSILMRKLRYEKGLIYSVNSFVNGYSDSGNLNINTSTSKKEVSEVVNIINQEIKNIIDYGLSEEEINFTKNRMIKSIRMQMQTSDSLVNFHANKLLLGSKKTWTLNNYVQEINNVTNKSIIKTAKEYLNQDKQYLSFCGDITEKEIKLESILDPK